MQRGGPPTPQRGTLKQVQNMRSSRYDLYVVPDCQHCMRLRSALRQKPMLMNQMDIKDARRMKAEGKKPSWLIKVPTILDYGEVVIVGKGQTRKSEPMIYAGTDAFRHVSAWVGDVPHGMTSRRFKNMASHSMAAGASAFISPYAITNDTFQGTDSMPIISNKKLGFAAERERVTQMIQQHAERNKGRR